MKKEELKLKVENLREEYDSLMEKYLEEGKSWDEFKNNPKVREYWKAVAEYRMIQDYTLRPNNDSFGELMPIEEFKQLAGVFFSDYDGSGYYATEKEISDIPCVPSEICDGYVRTDFSHVMWYNK